MATLLFLMRRSLSGRVTRWLRLMKQPKYLVGTLIGTAWFGMFALRPLLRMNGPAGLVDRFGDAAEWLPAIETGAALVLLVIVSLWWLWPFGKSSIELNETELHLLLPAPVTRRQLVQYAMLRSQGGILFGCLVIAVFSAGGGPAAFAWRFVSVWPLLTLWYLHARGRGLWIGRLQELPQRMAWRRRVLTLAAVGLLWAVLAPGTVRIATGIATATAAALQDLNGDTASTLRAMLEPRHLWAEAPLLSAALMPARLIVGSLFAGLAPDLTLIDRLMPLVWPLLLVVLHNEWIVRSQTRFEDATLERSRRQAQQGDANARFLKLRSRRREAMPFRLHPTGRPETAIVWKNLMLVHRTHLGRAATTVMAAMVAAAGVITVMGLPTWLIGILMFGGTVGLIGVPLLAGHQWRNDLRADLLRVELIRTWPIAGWRLFCAQVLPTTILATLYAAAAGGVLVLAGIAAGRTTGTGWVLVQPSLAASLGVSYLTLLLLGFATALPLAAAIAWLSATLQNLVALLWPSWIQLGRQRNESAANMGQGMLTAFGLMLAMGVGLLPGAALVALGLFIQLQVANIPFIVWELPILACAAIIPLAAITGLLTRFGGVLWDQLDPAVELLGTDRRT